jgi:hypothetical protein
MWMGARVLKLLPAQHVVWGTPTGGPALRALYAALLAAAAFAGAGCAPRDADVRLARLEAERRNLEQTLDRLEDRLLVNQARVRLWKELRERHESVSAVACASLEQHAEEIARRQGAQRGAAVRVAAARPGAAPAATRGAAE